MLSANIYTLEIIIPAIIWYHGITLRCLGYVSPDVASFTQKPQNSIKRGEGGKVFTNIPVGAGVCMW